MKKSKMSQKAVAKELAAINRLSLKKDARRNAPKIKRRFHTLIDNLGATKKDAAVLHALVDMSFWQVDQLCKK